MPRKRSVHCAIREDTMAKRKEFFLTGATSRITGVTPRNLDYWAKTKFIVPSVAEAKGTGTERKYAFNDLVAAGVLLANFDKRAFQPEPCAAS